MNNYVISNIHDNHTIKTLFWIPNDKFSIELKLKFKN